MNRDRGFFLAREKQAEWPCEVVWSHFDLLTQTVMSRVMNDGLVDESFGREN